MGQSPHESAFLFLELFFFGLLPQRKKAAKCNGCVTEAKGCGAPPNFKTKCADLLVKPSPAGNGGANSFAVWWMRRSPNDRRSVFHKSPSHSAAFSFEPRRHKMKTKLDLLPQTKFANFCQGKNIGSKKKMPTLGAPPQTPSAF